MLNFLGKTPSVAGRAGIFPIANQGLASSHFVKTAPTPHKRDPVSNPFDFLAPLIELETTITDLESRSAHSHMDVSREVQSLREKLEQESKRIFAGLAPWQRVQLSRHPQRPQTSDYIDHMVEDFVPLAGDRMFGDDEAIQCGLGMVGPHRCLIVGQQKGKDVHERRRCNFGMPHPEGYRKAMGKMRLAERFGLSVVCLVNTPGAFPGVEAEERGQSIAIAENIRDMAMLKTPIVVAVIGEGGSGGALGIGIGDRMLMLENSYFSVISPEGCAAILWKDGNKKDIAAERLSLTAQPLKKFGIVDDIIAEPAGGAHRQPIVMTHLLRDTIVRHLDELTVLSTEQLLEARYQKYRKIGQVIESVGANA
jgi:acetyl-CoA carboxylase carboxyl transferase subunit alpha